MEKPNKKYHWIHECYGNPKRKRRVSPGPYNKWRMRKWCEPSAFYSNGKKTALLKKIHNGKYVVSFKEDQDLILIETFIEAKAWLHEHGYDLVKYPNKKYDASRYVPHQQSFVPRPKIRKVALKTPKHPTEPNSGFIEI